MIKVTNTNIVDLKIIEPQVFEDDRGYFFESFNQNEFNRYVCPKTNFVQDNHSKSSYGVLRGLHYQKTPFSQAKLVRVISGVVFDVAVDLRINSVSFGSWFGITLSELNKKQLWIPKGFAHGFLVLSENAEILYKTDEFYNKDHEVIIKWNNRSIGIDWGNVPHNKIILSRRDMYGYSGSLEHLI